MAGSPPRFKSITWSRKGPVVFLTLNRPRAGNRVNRQMAWELAEARERIDQDEGVRVVVVTGKGSVFSAGWEWPAPRREDGLGPVRAAATLAAIEKPVIAALNGDALGQGLELALACDSRIGAVHARFGLPQIRAGLIPWDGGTQRLPRVIGRARALDLLLTGRAISADEACRWGLVSQVVQAPEVMATAQALAEDLALGAPIALRYTKEAIGMGMDMTLEQGLRLEADLNFLLHATRDRREGIQSFLQRRPPRFRGR